MKRPAMHPDHQAALHRAEDDDRLRLENDLETRTRHTPAPYGEVVRESPSERHERHVGAIASVLSLRLAFLSPETAHELADECLDALETGF